MKYFYVTYSSDKLQVFFALLAFIEKNRINKIFLVNDGNQNLFNECNKLIKFQMTQMNINYKYETITISINHQIPETSLNGNFNGTLLFPKLIKEKYYKFFDEKSSKIYFRGKLSLSRVKECIFLFFKIQDYQSLYYLLFNFIFYKKEFIINSSKIHFHFTSRGRQKETKFLDHDYYQEMAEYKYIYCPEGEYKWTYRFFEAIQVGSIPFVTKICDHYNDFYFISNFDIKCQNLENKAISNINNFKKNFYLK
jgi:hypothetical protein